MYKYPRLIQGMRNKEKRHDAGGEQCIRAKKDLTVIFWKPLWANRCNTKNMCYNVSKGERLVNVFSMWSCVGLATDLNQHFFFNLWRLWAQTQKHSDTTHTTTKLILMLFTAGVLNHRCADRYWSVGHLLPGRTGTQWKMYFRHIHWLSSFKKNMSIFQNKMSHRLRL